MAEGNNKYEGLKFAFACIGDLVFDFSHDSYRVPTLNTLGRVNEAIDFLENTPEKYITPQSLLPIVEELRWSIKSDRVASDIIGDKLHKILPGISEQAKPTSLKKNINLVKYYLVSSYREENKKRIIELCVNGKKKKEISECCKNYTVSILKSGYAKRFIREKIKEGLAKAANNIDAPEEIAEWFLKNFEPNDLDFSVISYVSKPLALYISELGSQNFRVFESDEGLKDELQNPNLNDKHLRIISPKKSPGNYRILLLSSLPVNDKFSAQRTSLDILNQFRSIAYAANNEVNLSWTESVIVLCDHEDQVAIVRPRRNILHNRRALNDGDKIVAFRKHLTALGLSRNDDKNRVFRSFSVASAAFELTHPESQLVSLWSALEAMLPEPQTSSRISSFLSYLVPANSLGYLNRIVTWNYQDLRNDIGEELDEILDNYKISDSKTESIALLLTKAGNNVHLTDLFSKISNPSLRNRIYTIHQQWQTIGDVNKFIAKHEQKVAWHIQRIYRSRNRIVHKGSAIVNDTLVLNLDEYFLNMMAQIANCLQKSSGSIQIDELFDLVCDEYRFYKAFLDSKNQADEISVEDIPLVFSEN